MGDQTNEGEAERVLSNHRRQQVVDQLQTHGTMTLRDLAEQIAVATQQRHITDLCEEAVEEVLIALHHVHLPKLQRAGLVEYDQRHRLVAPTDAATRADVADSTIDEMPRQDDSVSVDLRLETIDALHDAIRRDAGFGERMSYDEVVRRLLERHERRATADDDEAAAGVTPERDDESS